MSRIPEDKIDEVRTSVNIVHYIQQFVNLKKAGQNYKGLCPFHSEKTPSFVVSPDKQIYHCFGCGKGGNVFSFIRDYEKLSFTEAVRKAADFAGITLPKAEPLSPEKENYFQQLYAINETACSFFESNLWHGPYKIHLNYFKERALSEATIKKFRLGFAPDSYEKLLSRLKTQKLSLDEAAKLGLLQKKENGTYYDKFRYRVIFPFHDISGKIIGFGGRKLREEQQPKYLNSPESPVYYKGSILYGLHQAISAIREAGFALLVEGYFDLLRLVNSGIRNVVASSGTALTDQQAKLLRRYTKNVYVAYDGDNAGRKAAIRSAGIIEKVGLNAFIVPMPDGEDPDTFILNQGTGAFEALIKNQLSPLEFQISYFFTLNENPSLEEKEAFIQEILNQLTNLPNQVKTGLYLHQISERLQINEGMLVEQFNRYKRQARKQAARQTELKQQRAAAEAEQEPAPSKTVQTGMYKAEEGIIALLLNSPPPLRQELLNEVSIDLFENEIFERLFEFIAQECEETGQLDAAGLPDRFEEKPELAQTVSALAVMSFGDEAKFARDCIFQLKRYQLEKRAREISALIKQEADSGASLLHHNQELMRLRRELNELSKQRQDTKKF